MRPLISSLFIQRYTNNQCVGDTIVTDESFEANRWFTPVRDSADWQESFQDFSHITGYATLSYDIDMKSAEVTITAVHKSNATLTYLFDGKESPASKTFDTTTKSTVAVTVTASDKTTITLEPIDFAWNTADIELTYPKGDYREGQVRRAASRFLRI